MSECTESVDQASRLAQLYDRLGALAHELPPPQARPLWLAGHRLGWITQAASDALRNTGLIEESAEAVHLAPGQQPGPLLDAALARVANTLRDAQCLRGWRNELMGIVDSRGRHLGALERAAMRPLGLPTQAVHLNAWTPDGRLWVARRALSKSTDPGMWDTLVGGLAGNGEDLDLALVRECAEEAGLEPGQIRQREPLRCILRMHRRLPEGYQVENLYNSTCVLSANTQPANRDGEVMEIAAISAPEAIARVEAGEFTLEAALVIVEDIIQLQAAGRLPR